MTFEEQEPLLAKKAGDQSYRSLSSSGLSESESGVSQLEGEIESHNCEDDSKEISLTDLKFIVVCLSLYFGVFVAALDGTVVTSLLSHIASDLHELPRISWIATGYLVACAAFQPLYGKLSDIFGRKRVLLFCNVTFGVGCLLCGISSTLETLVLGRIISGIGGGGMLSLSTITLSDIVPLRKRGIFQGFGNIAFGLGAGVGGIFGGIVTANFGWRMAFNCQVPAVFISTLLVAIFTPHTKPNPKDDLVPEEDPEVIEEAYEAEHHHAHQGPTHPIKYIKKTNISRVDFWGSFTLVSSLIFLMLAISSGGRQYPWSHPYIVGSFSCAIVFVFLFIFVEMKVAREPVLPMQLFTHRTILASSLTNLFMTMSVYTILFFVPLCLTSVYDMSPTQVGQRLVANFFGIAIGSFGAGWYMKSTGKYYKLGVLSPLLYLFGVFIICQFNLLSQNIWQFSALFSVGTGYSAMLTVTLLALIAAVPQEFQAITTSIQYAFRGIGSTLGVSIASSIFQNVLASRLYSTITGPGSEDIINRVLDSVEEIRKIPIEYQQRVIEAYKAASLTVFITAFALAVVSIITSALMKEHELHDTMNRDDQNEQNEQHDV